MRRLLSSLAVLLGIAAAAPAAHAQATLSLLSGSQYSEPSQILPTINTVIQAINASTPFTGVMTGSTFKSGAYPPSAGAQFFGAGTTAAPFPLGTSADQTVGRLYGTALNTSGYARAFDARLYFGGVGGEGEAVRAYGIVNNVTAATGGTVNGLHASLSVTGANGKISGAGHAIRGTLELAAASTVGGTIDVLQLDTFAEGTVPATAAFISLANSGTNKLGYMLRLTAPATGMFVTAGSGATSCGAAAGATAAKVLKIVVDGVDYWIPLCSTNT